MAVLRCLRQFDPSVEATLLVPKRIVPWARGESVPVLAPPEEACSAHSLGGWILDTLSAIQPDRMIVDVFPRGILGELTGCFDRMPKNSWLLTRLVRPAYYDAAGIREAMEDRYERLLWSEEVPPDVLSGLQVAPNAVPPVLIRSPNDCLSRAVARRTLGITEKEELVLAVGAGDRMHQESLFGLVSRITWRRERRLARPVGIRFISELLGGVSSDPRLIAYYPAMELMRAADALVCSGGYHAFHESKSLAIPTVYVPQRRRYDDQFTRVAGNLVARGPAELELLVNRLLDEPRDAAPSSSPASRGDGARDVAELLLGS